MKTIEVIDLEKLDSSEITVVDVRSSEDYSKGTFNNAISIPILFLKVIFIIMFQK